MDNLPNILPGSQDDLRAENEVLKLKLELEHNMRDFASTLNPEAENRWLKSIYEFEVMLKKASKITVYELIGRPPIRPFHALKINEVSRELQKILGLLEKHGISITKLTSYDDIQFYTVITEELLPMNFGEFRNGPVFPPIVAWFDHNNKPPPISSN